MHTKITLIFIGIAALTACNNTAIDSEQCRTIAQHYLTISGKIEVDTQIYGDETSVNLRFKVKSALGEQPGQASCTYYTHQQGDLRPHRITIGQSVFTQPQDIQDLLDLRTEWPHVDHPH